MNEAINYLSEMSDLAVVIRIAIATLFGSLIGWERVARHHSAGIRTFALVSLGSAVATALNLYMAVLPGMSADVSRIPAGVVSGIGFLGAGTILVTGRDQIKGLSTAATLWVASCMGMAIGAGYLKVGFACFVLVMLANVVLIRISVKIEENNKLMSIYVEITKEEGVLSLTKQLVDEGFTIKSIKKSREKPLQSSDVAVIIDLGLNRRRSHQEILDLLSELDFVSYVEEV
jgi:putative Mg2+ transporter-C (MgtC) family protein